jgi:hypothetical protein
MNIKNNYHRLILLIIGLVTSTVIIASDLTFRETISLNKTDEELTGKLEIKTCLSQSTWNHLHHGSQIVLGLMVRAKENLKK